MTALTLSLLGRPQLLLHGEPVDLSSQKALALFFHLTMTGHVHSRQELAGLLWSDIGEDAARRNLRVELLKLRQVLDAYLEVSRDRISLNQREFTLDVKRFEACLLHHEPTFEELQEAVALYRGEFLEDFHVRDASLFEEWVTSERERLWQMARQAMLRLVEYYIQQQDFQPGMRCVDTLLKVEPWLEEAHQQRMRILALSGQRTAALAHYETASAILNDEFGVPPSDETNELYDQIESGELGPAGSPLAPRTLAGPAVPLPPPFQAPAAPLHFVGRTVELDALQTQLTEGDANELLALIGMAGVGKSTLAAHLAHILRDHFVDGVLWAYIAGSDPLDILGSWAQALGYDFSSLSDVENRAAALRGVLAEKRMLFVLDDVRSAARIRPLLVGGPNSATLLTTRDLDVAMALNAAVHNLAEMTLEDGEQLLSRVVGEERVQEEIDAAREICMLLQNLPLAVEIAAQRLRSRPRRRLQDMAERLRNMQERLDLSISDRAVRTSFLVSWESLDREQQRIFALLGVFAGRSFAPPAVAVIADLDLYIAEDRLFTLNALSLLNDESTEAGPADRYRQHPLLADFAQEQLGENRDVRLRMVNYYLTFAQEYQTDYTALQPEWGNLMAGLRCAHEQQEWPVVLAYADTLTEPWFTRARFTEAREAYALVREAAETVEDDRALAECLLRWGRACIEQYDFDEAEQHLIKSQSIFLRLGDEFGAANAQYHQGRIALEYSYHEKAHALLQASHNTYKEQDTKRHIAVTMYQLAILNYRQGNLEQANILCEQALFTQEGLEDQNDMIPTLRLMADVALEQQDYELAESHCMRALELAEAFQNRRELVSVYYMMTVVGRCLGKLEEALLYADRALELGRVTGDRGIQALALYELCRIHTSLGDFNTALQVGKDSVNLLRELRDSFNLVYVLRQLGDLYQEDNCFTEARTVWAEGLDLAFNIKHPLKEQLQQRLQSENKRNM